MSEVKKLVLKNYLITPLIQFLDRQELKSKMSRARFRVITILLDRASANEDARMELVKKHGKKDSDGKVGEENGKFVLEDENAFQAEYEAFVKEDAVFDVLPSNEADFDAVRGIVENTDEKFSANSRPTYRDLEEITEAFTNIK